jgi:hypothetical protein
MMSKQKIEDFMREFFRARIAEEQRHQTSRAPYRQRFFADDCRYDSHAGTLERMESERIVRIEEGESDSNAITEQLFHYSGGIRRIRLRYYLQFLNDNWLIRRVDRGCLVCEGRGDSNCPYCKGKQWLGMNQILE